MGPVCSQITCATNCATPGYSVFLHNTMRRRKKQVFRVCGRRCGQDRFYRSFSAGGFLPQATVPRTSGVPLLGEWMSHLSSQTKCLTDRLHPGKRSLSARRRRSGALFAGWALFYFTGFPRKVKSIPAAFSPHGKKRPAGGVASGRPSGHFVTQRRSSSTVRRAVSPALRVPSSIFSATASSTLLCMALRRGRAP